MMIIKGNDGHFLRSLNLNAVINLLEIMENKFKFPLEIIDIFKNAISHL